MANSNIIQSLPLLAGLIAYPSSIPPEFLNHDRLPLSMADSNIIQSFPPTSSVGRTYCVPLLNPSRVSEPCALSCAHRLLPPPTLKAHFSPALHVRLTRPSRLPSLIFPSHP
ncbi:hypothetical protein M405DRAFT_864610 [Rhizopogon salebrosus TDB-379]|nr:hypothetical protein M405DRAFT_864610 [Rhizopogon salebrosus TDB-379]